MPTQNQETDAAIDAAILPHLPRSRIKACYAAAPGNELRRKFLSQESSAALVANAFGLFLEQPERLEGLPTKRPSRVNLECEVRFPWAGGRHPYLDVLIESDDALTGVESKRYEPFRGQVSAEFSAAFRRPVWGDMMQGYEAIRDLLGANPLAFMHLDAAQLVKHALALRTAVSGESASHNGKRVVLVYLYAEPTEWPDGRPIPVDLHAQHRREVERFAATTGGSEVDFHPTTYQALLSCWEASSSHVLRTHTQSIREHFKV